MDVLLLEITFDNKVWNKKDADIMLQSTEKQPRGEPIAFITSSIRLYYLHTGQDRNRSEPNCTDRLLFTQERIQNWTCRKVGPVLGRSGSRVVLCKQEAYRSDFRNGFI